jgi:hypothetical protein
MNNPSIASTVAALVFSATFAHAKRQRPPRLFQSSGRDLADAKRRAAASA